VGSVAGIIEDAGIAAGVGLMPGTVVVAAEGSVAGICVATFGNAV
jgi:hypothetical protein